MRLRLPSSLTAIAVGAVLAAAPAVLSTSAHATAINGSDSLITFAVTPQGGSGDLLTATGLVFGTTLWGTGAGDFSGIPGGTAITPGTLTISDLSAFSFTSAYGTFQAAASLVIGLNTFTSAVVASSGSIAAGSESLTIYLVGNFTPSGSLSGFDPNNASETISFTETGITANSPGAFSVSATFAAPASAPPPSSPPTDAPEPASMALIGAGMAGLGMVRRRRRR
jgi:hypothetical protein